MTPTARLRALMTAALAVLALLAAIAPAHARPETGGVQLVRSPQTIRDGGIRLAGSALLP